MQPVETMDPPDPANVRLDPRLMTYQRLLTLIGDKPYRIRRGAGGAEFMVCIPCGHSITRVDGMVLTPLQTAADVCRHWVMAHDMPLSGAREETSDG